MINYYELAHNRRKNPPRADLVKRFTPETIAILEEKTTHWNQYQYLKMRHQLVELRREQYTLRDSYSQVILGQKDTPLQPVDPPEMDCDIAVLPLGLKSNNAPAAWVFREWKNLIPCNYNEEQL
jgi:hypothetical protein